MKLLALDLATKAGWAHSNGCSGTFDLSIRRDESGGMRLLRFRSKLEEIKRTAGVDVVVFESAVAFAKHASGIGVSFELQGILKAWCDEQVPKVNYRGFPPATIKKHGCGKGNAKKDAMIAAARVKWPHVHIEDDNQADALWILDLAMKELVPS